MPRTWIDQNIGGWIINYSVKKFKMLFAATCSNMIVLSDIREYAAVESNISSSPVIE